MEAKSDKTVKDSLPAEERSKTRKVSQMEGTETHTSPDKSSDKERSSSEWEIKSGKKTKVESSLVQKPKLTNQRVKPP